MRMWISWQPSTLKDIYIQLHEDSYACLRDFTNIYTCFFVGFTLNVFCAFCICHATWVVCGQIMLTTIKMKSMLNFTGVHQGF